VAHPDDEVIGLGGLLAFHGERGDEVLVVHATGGGAGDPEGKHSDLVARRQDEVRRALAELGLGAPEGLGFQDGQLVDQGRALEDSLRELFTRRAPELVYTFHGGEFHGDHRTLAERACAARGNLSPTCQVFLFGVNQPVSFGALFDYSALLLKKKKALAQFDSQLAYLDFATKVLQRDQAATVNVENPNVTHAELLLEVDLASWPQHLQHMRLIMEDAFPGMGT
jgi:LmbE family N-acetylglucosaminyl deacetylase